ncbi:hypothetical protein GJ496_009379 [Pomphorhynchus laevis]|nr:hypothetical protein GJ496_009379 [Pomphorhynchus laevis]
MNPWTIKLGQSLPGKLTDIYDINQTDDWRNIGCKVKQRFPAVFDKRPSQVNNFTASLRLTTDTKPCHFGQKEIDFLGVHIANGIITLNENKLDAINHLQIPRNKSELKSFSGMVTYHTKFIPASQEICRPLYQLTSRVTWKWTIEHTMCFRNIKDALRHSVSLTPYRLNKPLILTYDASNAKSGAALWYSRLEEKYSVIGCEALAIFFAVRRFHYYVYGRRFEIWTDHKPLVGILGDSRDLRTMTNTRMIRWALHLSGYNYTIKYIEGKDNVYADILSRSPTAARNVTVKQTYDLDNEDNISITRGETRSDRVVVT